MSTLAVMGLHKWRALFLGAPCYGDAKHTGLELAIQLGCLTQAIPAALQGCA